MGFPTSGLFEGFVRAHSDGRRWKWRASKGVWQIKHTAKSEAELVGDTGPSGADSTVPGPQGPPGATGSPGPQGPVGATFAMSGTTLNITT